jgi:pseudouridine synthase
VVAKSAMTLDRALSRFGVASRSVARGAILAGRVKVNGHVVRDPERWVKPERDALHLDGERLRASRRLYLLLYKPRGVITSHGDPGERRTVYDCLDRATRWVVPVGRLDKDTTGLLLLTNDTDFAHLVEDPESGVPKTYRVKASGLIDDATLARLAGGVDLGRGERAAPRSVRRLEDRGKYSWLEIVLTEGKNREVRRMLEAVGFKALKLVRTRIGPLTLAGLEIGKSRPLTPAEVAALKREARSGIQEPESRKSGRGSNRMNADSGGDRRSEKRGRKTADERG